MNTPTPFNPDRPLPESPSVAAAEARAVAPSLVAGVQGLARSRLLTVAVDALLVDVAALLSSAQISVVVVCNAAGAAVGVVTETILVRRRVVQTSERLLVREQCLTGIWQARLGTCARVAIVAGHRVSGRASRPFTAGRK